MTASTEPLKFHQLTYVPEGEDVVVGCPAKDSYAVFPASGVALLDQLRQGMCPQDAATWFQAEYGESVDVDDFLQTLRDVEFLRDGSDVQVPPSASHRLQVVARIVLSPPALCGYAVIAVAAGWALVADPALRPRPANIFFSESLLIIQLGLLIGGPLGIAWHELFHVHSGAELGLPCREAVSRRMYFLVFESRLNGLLTLPRKRRYPTFLAGMLADVVLFSTLTVAAAALGTSGDGPEHAAARIALALAYVTMLRFLWQFYFCLRTDLFYVISTALPCHDLHGATMTRLRNLLWKTLRRPGRCVDESEWTDRDRAVARSYAPAAALGFLFLIYVGVQALLPIAVTFVQRCIAGLRAGVLGLDFWDSALSLALGSGPLIVVAAVNVRERRHQQARRP